MNTTLPKSYLSKFARTGILLFAAGAVVTAAGLSLLLQDRGTSYADSFKLLAALNRDLVNGSLILFTCILLLSLAGILVIAIVYSHRVAGPLYKLGLHTRKISSGELSGPVHLRNTDVLHVLADDLNNLSGQYRSILAQLRTKTGELEAAVPAAERQSAGDDGEGSTDTLAAPLDEINTLLSKIKL